MGVQKKDFEKLAELTAEKVTMALKKERFVGVRKSPYQKTEAVLHQYVNLKRRLKEREEYVRRLEIDGVDGKSASIVTGSRGHDVQQIMDRENEILEHMRDELEKSKKYMLMLERVLAEFEQDEDYLIVQRYYFEKVSMEDIMAELFLGKTAAYQRRKKMVHKIAAALFMNDYFAELFG